MGNVGRIICVALPFVLTVASLIALLVAALAGVTDKSLYAFKINTANLSVSTSVIASLLDSKRSVPLADLDLAVRGLHQDMSDAASAAADTVASVVSGTNVTAADLGLADAYHVNLWNYCRVDSNGTTSCNTARFDWATNATTAFETKYKAVVAAAGANDSVPATLKTAMNTFATVTRWTEIVFIIAIAGLGLTLVFGIFAACSRAISCCAWIVAVFSVVAVGAAAGLATGMAAGVVGLAEGSAKVYGVTGAFNKRFLSTVWIAFVFILVATGFWLASACCCGADHRRSGRSGGSNAFGGRSGAGKDHENLSMTTAAGSYARLHDNQASAYTGAGGMRAHGGAADSYHHAGDGAKYESYRNRE